MECCLIRPVPRLTTIEKTAGPTSIFFGKPSPCSGPCPKSLKNWNYNMLPKTDIIHIKCNPNPKSALSYTTYNVYHDYEGRKKPIITDKDVRVKIEPHLNKAPGYFKKDKISKDNHFLLPNRYKFGYYNDRTLGPGEFNLTTDEYNTIGCYKLYKKDPMHKPICDFGDYDYRPHLQAGQVIPTRFGGNFLRSTKISKNKYKYTPTPLTLQEIRAHVQREKLKYKIENILRKRALAAKRKADQIEAAKHKHVRLCCLCNRCSS